MIIKHEKVKEQIILLGPFAECILLQMFEEDPLFLKERRGDKHIQLKCLFLFNDIEIFDNFSTILV